ncbi:MAG: hypothetical protein ACI9A1_001476, partial [Lentimonas sp.]
KHAHIFESKIRDAIIVRRAVTLGLPVNLVKSLGREKALRDDCRNVTEEILRLQSSN